jgi:cysteine desulfurase family protein (TIGR01976 family)
VSFPIDLVRARFPALDDRAFFDAPGGTQVCAPAIERMVSHLRAGTANAGGTFSTSQAVDQLSKEAHQAVADLLGGTSDEIAFGPNMTSLTFAVSRALARDWAAGDNLVVTRLDHDANIAPWLAVAADLQMEVRWIDFDPDTGRLRLDALPGLLDRRTRMVAVGAASNALGTLNDVPAITATVRAHSAAFVYVDAVQSVPHVATNVGALGCDLLACSPYKFFGPHQGVLWGRADLLEQIRAYKVRPAGTHGAHRFETGTPSFEGQAGVLGTIDYLEWLGREVDPAANSRRARLLAAMEASAAYEQELAERLLTGLTQIPGLRLYGPTTADGRVPTFAFTLAGHQPDAVARHLASRDIFAWSGHFYAVELIRRLGLEDQGGLIRVGLCHYSTAAEVDRLIAALNELY